MTRRARTLLMLSTITVGLAACGRSPAAPAPVVASVGGAWTGTAKSAAAIGNFTLPISLSIAQTGTAVSGSYGCSSVFCMSPTGTVSGTVSATTFTAQIVFPNGGICGTFNATVLAGGTRMEGTYACNGPDGPDSGTWQMTK